MNIISEQLRADRDRMFADWGEAVTLRKVTQTFEPATQQISEVVTETTTIAIVGEGPTAPIPDAGGHVQTVDLILQIKAEEWTGTLGDVTWQADVRGITYQVIQQNLSAEQQVVELACRKVAGQ